MQEGRNVHRSSDESWRKIRKDIRERPITARVLPLLLMLIGVISATWGVVFAGSGLARGFSAIMLVGSCWGVSYWITLLRAAESERPPHWWMSRRPWAHLTPPSPRKE